MLSRDVAQGDVYKSTAEARTYEVSYDTTSEPMCYCSATRHTWNNSSKCVAEKAVQGSTGYRTTDRRSITYQGDGDDTGAVVAQDMHSVSPTTRDTAGENDADTAAIGPDH